VKHGPSYLPAPTRRAGFLDRDDLGCRSVDPNLFFQEYNTGGVPDEVAAACRSCPALEPCREHGIEHEPYGVWGGMSPFMREVERQRRNGMQPRACVVCGGQYTPLTAGQRACGSACARRITKRGTA
jgi:hypothetical protein